MERNEIVGALTELGLSRDEAEIYTLIVSVGSCTVGKISTLTEFSRAKIYAILDTLLSRGWINAVSDKPRTFIPADPRKVIQDKKESMLIAYESAIENLTPIYESSRSTVGEAVIYRGFDVFKQLERMLSNAKKEINIITAFLPTEVVEKMLTLLNDAKDRDVKVRIIVGERLKDEPLVKKLAENFRVEVKKTPNAGILIVDGNEVLFGSGSSTGILKETNNLLGIWTGDKELVKLNEIIFDQILKERP